MFPSLLLATLAFLSSPEAGPEERVLSPLLHGSAAESRLADRLPAHPRLKRRGGAGRAPTHLRHLRRFGDG